MSAVCAIGEEVLLEGYALLGVSLLPAEDAVAARAAWESLPGEAQLVVLTPKARAALGKHLHGRDLLVVVLPS